mgnify:FL=1
MNINSSELNIKNIKNDPDELNLNIVNLKTELSSDDEKSNVDSDLDLELDLDIEEL